MILVSVELFRKLGDQETGTLVRKHLNFMRFRSYVLFSSSRKCAGDVTTSCANRLAVFDEVADLEKHLKML